MQKPCDGQEIIGLATDETVGSALLSLVSEGELLRGTPALIGGYIRTPQRTARLLSVNVNLKRVKTTNSRDLYSQETQVCFQEIDR